MTNRFLISGDDGEHHSTGEVVRRLRKVFPLVLVNYKLGGYRLGKRLRMLREANAPECVMEVEEQCQQQAIQLSIFDGEPLTQILDLTIQGPSIRTGCQPGCEGALRRIAAALDYEIGEDPQPDLDDRESAEERKYWTRAQATRDNMASLRASFEGAEGIFIAGSHVSRIRAHGLKLTEPFFYASLELLPTRGLWNDLPASFGFRWRWDEFSCGPEYWIRGPIIVESVQFEGVAAVVRYCEGLADPTYSSTRRLEISRVIQASRK